MNIQKLTFCFILKLSECLATPLFENSQVLELEQLFELIEGEDFWQKNTSLEGLQDLFQSFSLEESQDILTPPLIQSLINLKEDYDIFFN